MTQERSAELTARIAAALDAFNRKDSATFTNTFRGEVVIIDGFAPFRWIGPDAAARWWADADTWAKAGGVAKEHVSIDHVRYTDVKNDRAYAVVSATLTITLKAAPPIVRPGILVYTFARQDDAWNAEGQMWGRLG